MAKGTYQNTNHKNNPRNNNTMEVKSAYNFVPAPSDKEVFYPDWADQVSHDIPFSDGESGEIKVTITAKTPIFIRNGHAQGTQENEFSHYISGENKKYFIPATSIKGMLRNVMEIMSMGKMKQVDDDDEFSFRDLSRANNHYMNLMKDSNNNKTHCGWITINNEGKWLLEDCGEPGRISHTELKEKKDLSFRDDFLNREPIKGPIILNDNTVKYFKFVYRDKDKQNISSDWKYWKAILKDGGKMPVFFKKKNGTILHFGLSYLYKLPYKYSLKDLIDQMNFKNKPDMAELVFGTINNTKLKGRVYISNAFLSNKPIILEEKKEILASPKASFFPYYLNQESMRDNLIDYDSDNAKLNGFKRYPVQLRKREVTYPSDISSKVFSTFKPLDSGSEFTFKIRYHNLKKVELGALISCITFHQNTVNQELFHSLGSAKPLGYGKVKLTINTDLDYPYMAHFEHLMNEHFSNNIQKNSRWIESKQIKELFAMAKSPNEALNKNLSYPILNAQNKINEFQIIKKGGTSLPKYSTLNELSSISGQLDEKNKSIISEEVASREKIIKEIEQKVIEQQIKKNSLISDTRNEFDSLLLECEFEEAQKKLEKLKSLDSGLDYEVEKQKIETYKQKFEDESYFNKVLTSNDIEFVRAYISENPFKERIGEVRSHLRNILPAGLPERLISGNLTLEQFLKEASQWKKRNTDIFTQFENKLIDQFLILAFGQNIERSKRKIEDLFSDPNSIYDRLSNK